MVAGFRVKEIIILKKSCKVLTRKKFEIRSPALVSRAKTIPEALSLVNGFEEIKKGQKVLIKPNINSDDVYPGTTRKEGLAELIRLLKKRGAEVTVGDMSSLYWRHTRECSEKVSIKQVCEEEGVPLIFFEDCGWVEVELPNTSLKSCYITEELCNHDHLINLCVLKTHRVADFTLSLKNLMGMLHPRTRIKMHTHNLKQGIGEFNLALTPILNIVDGTKCFIDGGPDVGVLREPGIVFAGRDRVALDVTCIRTLQSLGSKSLEGLNPWEHPQIKTAVNLGLGAKSDGEIRIVSS